VTIAGKTQIFAYDKLTELSLTCENIALPVFNPYSGRYAGYNIERGELTTDIHYLLRNRKLSAQHHVRIDQLTWGKESDTKPGAPLPVRLATALLRDRNGVIELDLPVNGSLDDPSFHVWPLVWKVVKNIVVKAATAPFDFLGSLFKGAEKARFVEFKPGEASLDSGAEQALTTLGKVLSQRPSLRVDVPVASLPELDRAALAERKYRESVEDKAAAAQRRQHAKRIEAFAALDTEEKSEVLAALYQELAGSAPRIPKPPKAPEGTSRKAKKQLAREHELGALEQAVRAKIVVQPEELLALGRARAEAVERALVRAGKVDATRVLLTRRGKVSPNAGRVRLELEIE
jgi:hypothetical protein